MALAVHLAELGWLPEHTFRATVRRRLRKRIRGIELGTDEERLELLAALVARMDASPLAAEPDPSALEAPAGFFRLALGRHLKSSCCFWPAGTPDLDAAEAAMLERTCDHARIEEGMNVLDLGCGWGSLALWIAERYRSARVLAVAASPAQKAFVDRQAAKRGLTNLESASSELASFDAGPGFDRVLAIETLAHTRNYGELLRRIAGWLRPGGRLLIQSAGHRRWPYLFDSQAAESAAATRLFAAGLVPSDDLIYEFRDRLEVEHQWSFSGEHYQRTAEAWLRKMSARRPEILVSLREAVGPEAARLAYRRWRLLFLSCAEQFGFHRGQEWWLSHYLLRPTERGRESG